MDKNLCLRIFLTAMILALSTSDLVFADSDIDHSKPAGDSSKSLALMIKEAVIEKAKVSLEGLSAMLVRALSGGVEGKKFDLKAIGSQLMKMQKFVLSDLAAMDSLSINNGILILSPGDKNGVSYLATPEQKRRVTCKTGSRNSVHLGFAGYSRDGSEDEPIVVFVATYVAGKVPKIIASGQSRVFLRKIENADLFEIDLSQSARCVAQEIRVDQLRVRLAGKSSLNSASLGVRLLDVTARDESKVNLIGAIVSEQTTVFAKGRSLEHASAVRLQGKTVSFEAQTAYASLDCGWFEAADVILFPAKTSKSVEVFAGKKLHVFPAKRKFARGEPKEGLVIEYVGGPDDIQNSSGIALRNAREASSLLSFTSTLASGEGLSKNGRALAQDVKKIVNDAMTVAGAFLGVVAG